MNHILAFLSAPDMTIIFFLPFIIFPLIFLAIRGILLWYWKVNDILKNQEQQNILLAEIAELLKKQKGHAD